MPAPIDLVLPDPCLLVLVGAAGAGKTTLAARHFAADEVLSSDAFRGFISGDPSDQRATNPAFRALHAALRRRLARGLLTVIDATSVTARDRRPLLAAADAASVPSVALVLALPVAVVLARNASRPTGVVPELAVRRHLARLEASLYPPGIWSEGFAQVAVLEDPADVDALRIVRLPRGPERDERDGDPGEHDAREVPRRHALP